MKITVKIDDELFEVEVSDIHARPVVAVVDGEYFEVWPEIGPSPAERAPSPAPGASRPGPRTALPPTPTPKASPESPKAVHAPIPGVIVAINVAVGDKVSVGQELCTLEAMKMKNAIRSPRAGNISRVVASVGDHVKHHDLLFEFDDICD